MLGMKRPPGGAQSSIYYHEQQVGRAQDDE